MITLTADSNEYGNSKQYIARISGRDSKFTFRREFAGRKTGRRNDRTEAFVDEPGLFEICDIDKKGRKDLGYALIVRRTPDCPPLSETADPDFIRFDPTTEQAVTLARRMDDGDDLAEIVEITRAEDGYHFQIRSKSEAKKASAAASIDQAVEECWQILQAFPEREAKKVMAALKLRVSPPKLAAVPEATAPMAEMPEVVAVAAAEPKEQ